MTNSQSLNFSLSPSLSLSLESNLAGSTEKASPLQALMKGDHVTFNLMTSASDTVKVKVGFAGVIGVSVEHANTKVNATTIWGGAAGLTVRSTSGLDADFKKPDYDFDPEVKKFVDDKLVECKLLCL